MSRIIVVLFVMMAFQCAYSKKVLIRHHKAEGQNIKQCLLENCKPQLQTCAKDSSCVTTIKECANKFKKSDDLEDFEKCLDGNEAAGKTWSCLKSKCLNDKKVQKQHLNEFISITAQHNDLKSCMLENCKSQLQTCANDSTCVSQIKTCGQQLQSSQNVQQFETCLSSHANANSVWQCLKSKCLNGEVQLSHVSSLMIITENHDDLKECMLTNCKSQLQTCANDATCVSQIKTCGQQLQTSQNVQQFETCLSSHANANSVWLCLKSKCLNGQIDKLHHHILKAIKESHEYKKEFMSCLRKNCLAQVKECQNDKQCLSKLDQCSKTEAQNGLEPFEKCFSSNKTVQKLWICIKSNCMNTLTFEEELMALQQATHGL